MIQLTQDVITLPIDAMLGLMLLMGFIGAMLYDFSGIVLHSVIGFFADRRRNSSKSEETIS
jgi:ABC-type amino acid transport system permease subunit